jgi:hypothetical protein
LQHSGIPERFDMAIMSTKGVPVDAACNLIESLVAEGVRIFTLHDFDEAGFKILRTLRTGTRLSIGADVIDLGLRLADTEGLPDEPVTYDRKTSPAAYLRLCGVTDDEIAFLVEGGYPGRYADRRVEINAMTSEQLIDWLETQFEAHSAHKIIPGDEAVAATYQRAVMAHKITAKIKELQEEMEPEDVPADLAGQVEALLAEEPALSWDAAVWRIASSD